MPHFLSRGTPRRAFRAGAAISSLVLILGLTACGGGGGGGGGGDSQLNNRAPSSSGDAKPSSPEPSTNEDTAQDTTDTSSPVGNEVTETPTGGTSGRPVDPVDVNDPVDPVTDNGDNTITLPDLPVSEVAGAVLLEWNRPDQRENGDYLEDFEIGGYELRYYQVGDDKAQVILLDDPAQERIELANLVGSYQFSIAVFDTDGLYSEFVPLSPVSNLL